MTIASMDFNGMEEVYLYNYSNVREMMDAFYKKDDHCAYADFADQYEKYDALTKNLSNYLIKSVDRYCKYRLALMDSCGFSP